MGKADTAVKIIANHITTVLLKLKINRIHKQTLTAEHSNNPRKVKGTSGCRPGPTPAIADKPIIIPKNSNKNENKYLICPFNQLIPLVVTKTICSVYLVITQVLKLP